MLCLLTHYFMTPFGILLYVAFYIMLAYFVLTCEVSKATPPSTQQTFQITFHKTSLFCLCFFCFFWIYINLCVLRAKEKETKRVAKRITVLEKLMIFISLHGVVGWFGCLVTYWRRHLRFLGCGVGLWCSRLAMRLKCQSSGEVQSWNCDELCSKFNRLVSFVCDVFGCRLRFLKIQRLQTFIERDSKILYGHMF